MRSNFDQRLFWLFFRTAIVFAVVCLFLSIGSTECWACPNCKEAVANESHQVQQGYVLSILLMMGTPFAIIAGWTIAIVRLRYRQRNDLTAGV